MHAYVATGLMCMLIFADAKPLNHNQVKFRRVPPKEFSAALGSSITIECEAGASPQPTIHWLKNGKRIHHQEELSSIETNEGQLMGGQLVDDTNRIGLSATGARLFIDCASLDDEAIYTCVAENEFSRVSTHTKLNIIKPAALQAVIAEAEAEAEAETNDLLDNSSPASSSSSTSKIATIREKTTGAKRASNNNNEDEASALDLIAARREQEAAEKALSAIPQCLSQRGQAQATGKLNSTSAHRSNPSASRSAQQPANKIILIKLHP